MKWNEKKIDKLIKSGNGPKNLKDPFKKVRETTDYSFSVQMAFINQQEKISASNVPLWTEFNETISTKCWLVQIYSVV